MLHLRVVSPPDVTGAVMPMLRSEPGVINLTVLPGAVSHPDGDAVHFDVLHGAANDVIGQLRGLGLDQRGAIVLENVDTSICGLADQAAARRGPSPFSRVVGGLGQLERAEYPPADLHGVLDALHPARESLDGGG